MVDILSLDQLRSVLSRLEKIEVATINLLKTIRAPNMHPDLCCEHYQTLLDIQIRIGNFRCLLTKNCGGFNRTEYQDFIAYAGSAMDRCNLSFETYSRISNLQR